MTESPAGAAVATGFWPRLAADVQAWFAAEGVVARDAIVLLPFAQLLAPARAAFAQAGGWQPRIETTPTLLASIAPVGADVVGPGHDAAADRLAGAALLRAQPWGAAWQRRDARGFERAVAAMVSTAQALARAAQARAPGVRDAWWDDARALLAPLGGPGATERALARVALEWAASADGGAGDALFALRPAAWVQVRAGEDDALASALLAAATVPTRVIDADGDEPLPLPSLHVADGLEDEAQAAAALVLHALQDGRAPVALIAQDRLLVRRVRALLERARVPLHDETGWTLSTTRSAARVIATLRAASPRATPDDKLDWLKGDDEPQAEAVALEAHWRRHAGALPEWLERWWTQRDARLAPLRDASRRPLDAWLAALAAALPLDRLAADDAGAQLLDALRLDGGWGDAAAGWRGTLDEFTAWVADTLELHTYLPAPQAGAQVIVTPLARAMLRPFGAVVFPGTDDVRLGAAAPPHPLLPDALLAPLGLPDAAARRRHERLALAQLLRLPNVVLLRRRRGDDGEALERSPLVEQVLAGQPLVETEVALPRAGVKAAPVACPAPRASPPLRLSASQVEALRDCPYRFYARAVLALSDAEELEAELHKRDYGTWLHAALLRFHAMRDAAAPEDVDLALLHACADAASAALDAAQLLPFRAAFDAFAPRYVQWQRARDAAGWRYAEGETEHERTLPALPEVRLHGRIDRLDTGPGGDALIDYKAKNADDLRRLVREPLEDTQLAIYAALLGGTPGAMYVAVDGRKAPEEIVHHDVAASADALLAGLAGDLSAMQRGAPLAALGEEPVCGHCEMRGLCRRDHWEARE
jgi:ATP-dependent helicase/nuclease subunit B